MPAYNREQWPCQKRSTAEHSLAPSRPLPWRLIVGSRGGSNKGDRSSECAGDWCRLGAGDGTIITVAIKRFVGSWGFLSFLRIGERR
jgi:hypothetical protein